MTDQDSAPEIFTADKRQIGKGWMAIVVVGIFVLCELVAGSSSSSGISPYVAEIVGLVFAAIASYVFYSRIKAVAPTEGDKVSVYSDRIEIQKQGNVRAIDFKDITSLRAITNQYGIIFLQINIGFHEFKIVGINNLKGLFESISKHLPASSVSQENFLATMIKNDP